MRRVFLLALLALALPIATSADIIITNQYGSVSVSTAGITSTGSQLKMERHLNGNIHGPR